MLGPFQETQTPPDAYIVVNSTLTQDPINEDEFPLTAGKWTLAWSYKVPHCVPVSDDLANETLGDWVGSINFTTVDEGSGGTSPDLTNCPIVALEVPIVGNWTGCAEIGDPTSSYAAACDAKLDEVQASSISSQLSISTGSVTSSTTAFPSFATETGSFTTASSGVATETGSLLSGSSSAANSALVDKPSESTHDLVKARWRQERGAPDFDTFWSAGLIELPRRGEDYVFLSEFRADPANRKLATPSGKIELYSERIAGFGYADCPPHATWLEPIEWLGSAQSKTYPFHLVSGQPRYRLHSQMDGGPVSALGKVAGREAVAINPADAVRRGIKEGDVVRVFNARGSCLGGATLTESVTPGVLRLSCGAWYDPDDQAVCVHGNANVLTYDRGTSRLGQGPSSATTLVDIERWTAPVPPVRAFVPPRMVEQV